MAGRNTRYRSNRGLYRIISHDDRQEERRKYRELVDEWSTAIRKPEDPDPVKPVDKEKGS